MSAAALLGLPAALFAHVLVFGGRHIVGGSLHGTFIELAAGFALIATLTATIGALRKLPGLVPGFAGSAVSTAVWFGSIELCEQGHGIPLLSAAAAIAIAAFVVRAIVLAFVQTVRAVVSVLRTTFTGARGRVTFSRPKSTPLARSLAHRFRLFSRPPPAFA